MLAWPMRLFPSKNGWFLTNEKPSAAAFQRRVEVLAAKGHLRPRQGGLQCGAVTKTEAATRLGDKEAV